MWALRGPLGIFLPAQDETVPLETLFTCLICIYSLCNSLSSIVLFFGLGFWGGFGLFGFFSDGYMNSAVQEASSVGLWGL